MGQVCCPVAYLVILESSNTNQTHTHTRSAWPAGRRRTQCSRMSLSDNPLQSSSSIIGSAFWCAGTLAVVANVETLSAMRHAVGEDVNLLAKVVPNEGPNVVRMMFETGLGPSSFEASPNFGSPNVNEWVILGFRESRLGEHEVGHLCKSR